MNMTDLEWKKETEENQGQMDAFLLIGQSNMSGRGIIGQVPPIDPRGMMFLLRNGCWQPMSEPINPDRRIFVTSDTQYRSGVSLAASFAECYADTYGRKIGLIPCADGGSKLDQWQPGEILFDHAIMQARLAQRSSRIVGILWHQGESDARDIRDVETYKNRFFTMLSALTRELGVGEDIPVVVGEISLLVLNRWTLAHEMNAVLHDIAVERPNTGIASEEGLTLSADDVHFSAASYREFGKRYFAAYQSVQAGMYKPSRT